MNMKNSKKIPINKKKSLKGNKFKSMKFLFINLIMLFFSSALFAEILVHQDWKLDVDPKSGRFVIYYKDIALNAKDYPLTNYFSLKVGKDVYHLGEDVSVFKIEKINEKIIFVYKISAKMMVEIEVGFGDNPYVYDDKIMNFQVRIDNRLDKPTEVSLRFVLDTAVGEEKNQGYFIYPDLKTEIKNEFKESQELLNFKKDEEIDLKETKDTVIFYPFYIKSTPTPSELYLSSWQRLDEEFNPLFKPLLSFRDMRTSRWDPAITYFYHINKGMQQVDLFRFSIGLWQKPTRNVPRVKIFYPSEIQLEDKKNIELPIMVENNGDYEIDFFKINLNSSIFKTQLIQSGSKLLLKQKTVIEYKEPMVKEKEVLTGEIRITLWYQGRTYDQAFTLNIKLKPKAILGRKIDPIKTEKKEGQPVLDLHQIGILLGKIDLLFYFLNLGIEMGMSPEVLEKLRGEIHELEKQSLKKNTNAE